MKIICVVGARPNFMKMAPILRAFRKYGHLQPLLVHTNQHYDAKMSDVFFKELGMAEPDIHLNAGSGTHAVQSADIMIRFEKALMDEKPGLVIVVGDVNSTLACSVASAKLHIPVAHVEAGLRSNDRSMPEEINRLVTDTLSDYLFTTESSGNENLIREGKKQNQIFFTGNVMIDTLVYTMPKIDQSSIIKQFPVKSGHYALVTLHRPSNVDQPDSLNRILTVFETITQSLPVLFPIHPRTRKNLDSFGFQSRVEKMKDLILTDPIGYIDFLNLMKNAKCVISDSGGLQEESTFLRVPCLTMRENTERPVTITVGTNTLVGSEPAVILGHFEKIMNGTYKKGDIPELWDGHAAERIADIISRI